ncbi:MAG TPA: hypothetical protein VE979_09920 [Streptosporangiaceae bacterium]|jgi:hypothetical protein|nr:hypothetical protein [Streptosporangiaceae bacterium]
MTRFTRALRSRTAAVATAAGAAAVLTATFVQAQPAGALPRPQAVCDLGTIAITAARGYVPLTDPITVTPSLDAVKAEVTADVGVDAGAEVRIAWKMDQGNNHFAPQEGQEGPANFANHQEFFETRTTFALFGPGAGVPATITPMVRVSGPPTARATLLHRCFTLEAATS